VLRELPPFAADKVKAFVTAGSPLRKYVDLFAWGSDAGCISEIPWLNFWDATDPVADPLVPSKDWRRGTPVPPPAGNFSELYSSIDPNTNQKLGVTLTDTLVNNAASGAGGGLPAHNYWDNDRGFVEPLARLVRGVATA
jgi:hypothetical protein